MHFNWGYPCKMRYEKIELDWSKMRSENCFKFSR